MLVFALKPSALSNYCNPETFSFKTTSELKETVEFIGQKRAFDAIQFGIHIVHHGYNLYALGPDNIGKKTIIMSILEAEAAKTSAPSDWCYVFNFKDQRCPVALELPAGIGNQLQSQMNNLIEDLKSTLQALFETEEHHARIKQINEEVTQKQKKYFDELQIEAEKHEMTILSTSKGFVVVPIKSGKVLTTKNFEALSDKERNEKEEITEELSGHLAEVISKIQKLHKRRLKKEQDFEQKFTLNAATPLFKKIKATYADFPQVIAYLDSVLDDVVNNVKLFLRKEEEFTPGMWGESHPSEFAFSRYQVNVIIDNSNTKGVPIVYEDNARYYKIIGRIEHVSQFGALVTDFTLIRQGALHRANGGYLILDANKILEESLSWEALKRALLSHQINIELPPTMISVTSTATLEPEPIPLQIKIILIGNRLDYYYLRDTDAEFNDLFKVAVDFEENIYRTQITLDLYAKLIATKARRLNLKPFDNTAVARIIDHSSRIMEDSEKIALNMCSLLSLMEESDHWAAQAGRMVISNADVQHAIDSQIFRLDHYQQVLYDEIQRDVLLINTQGQEISQINALTTYRLGEFVFGFPARITATARVGREGIIDIEREVHLSGPIHAKGVLILSGFLKGRYAHKWPLTLSASIVFEQSYGEVEGDSASVAELCTLLSALSQVPIKQNLAVTGSVNQHGLVQAIGNVNEKIEGFFDICQKRGLTGDQGVVIPYSNIKNLMLRDDVIAAAQAQKFFIYPIKTVDQAIALLLGADSGQRDAQGNYPEDSINFLVEKQLKEFAKINKKWTKDIL